MSESMVEKTVIWLSILHNDERPNGEKHGYFCQNSYKTFGTTIINILYVKTVVVKAPGKEVYRNNNEPLVEVLCVVIKFLIIGSITFLCFIRSCNIVVLLVCDLISCLISTFSIVNKA